MKDEIYYHVRNFLVDVIITLSIVNIVVNICHADQPSISLTQGQPAPFTGVLVDPARIQRIDNLQLDYEHLVKVDSLKDEDIKVLNDRVNNSNKEVQDLASRVVTQDNSSHWKELGSFVLGAVLTGAISWGVVKVVK